MFDVIEAALKALGCREIRYVYDGKATATCPNEHEHDSGRDWTPSYVVFWTDEGSVVGRCMACHMKEPLEKTLLHHQWVLGKQLSPVVLALRLAQDDAESVEDMLDGLDFDAPAVKPKDVVKEELEIIDESAYAPFAGSVPAYAIARGLTIETCRAWELGHDKKRGRLLFPTRDVRGRLVGITGRLYHDVVLCSRDYATLDHGVCPRCGWKKPAKYMHSKGRRGRRRKWRSLVLYGEHMIVPGKTGLLVEGSFDVIKVWQAGVRNVVGSLGTVVDEFQLERMREWWDTLYVWGDPDTAGDKMMDEVKAAWEARGGVCIVVKDRPDVDPGDAAPEAIRATLHAYEYPDDLCAEPVENT